MSTRQFLFLINLLSWGYAAAQPPEMVFVQGGTFEMGCTPEQIDCESDESPAHEVTIPDFYIGQYEVTQAQWAAVVPEYAPNYGFGEGNSHPAYYISWYDAVTFCNRLSQQEGYTPAYYTDPGFTQVYDALGNGSGTIYWDLTTNGYRLPTEAEWEYAARGGALSQGFLYSGSNNIDTVAWYSGNENGESRPVGTKAANELNIYDMSGNIREWCWDWYDETYYNISPTCAPSGVNNSLYRVHRGSSWSNPALVCRVAFRGPFPPGDRNGGFGFRLSRSVE